eukprot:scaffold12657_cov106-Cylindrotheca_fusiformis.AAC.2
MNEEARMSTVSLLSPGATLRFLSRLSTVKNVILLRENTFPKMNKERCTSTRIGGSLVVDFVNHIFGCEATGWMKGWEFLSAFLVVISSASCTASDWEPYVVD